MMEVWLLGEVVYVFVREGGEGLGGAFAPTCKTTLTDFLNSVTIPGNQVDIL